jgi:pimeloyl-ACP methyl ester carboxylesterase
MFQHTHGNGDRMVVGFHGWSGTHETFNALAGLLPADARLMAFDLPGFGRSEPPPRWDVEWMGRQLAEYLEHRPEFQHASHVTLVSSCAGCYPLLACAQSLTRPVDRIVLVDAFAFAPWYFRVFTNRHWGHYAYYCTFANPLGRWLTNRGLADKRADPDANLARAFEQTNHRNTLEYLRACVDLGHYSRFADLRAEIVLAYGEKTFGAVRESLAMWQESWPDATRHELKGAGHLGLQEAPEQIAELVFAHSPEPAVTA